MKALFPEWNTDEISYIQFKDGITNKCKLSMKKNAYFYVCFWIGSTFKGLSFTQPKTKPTHANSAYALLFFFSWTCTILNLVVICCTYKPTGVQILVRAYGKKSEVIIDRKQEIMVSFFNVFASRCKERKSRTDKETKICLLRKEKDQRAMTARKMAQDCRTVDRTHSTRGQERWQGSRRQGDTREWEIGRAEQDTT